MEIRTRAEVLHALLEKYEDQVDALQLDSDVRFYSFGKGLSELENREGPWKMSDFFNSYRFLHLGHSLFSFWILNIFVLIIF